MANQIGIVPAYGEMGFNQQQVDLDVPYTAFLALFSTKNGALDYLTQTQNGGRGLTQSTLKFYRIGMKTEKFRQPDGRYDLNE